MSNSKISALTSATTPLAGTETLPIVQSSTTKQVSVANLTAGRAISASSATLSSLTSGRVTYATTSGLLTDSANLQFNGTTLGVAVTPNSTWSGYKAIQFGDNGSVANSGGTSLFGWNVYYDGSYKYLQTGQSSMMLISPSGAGGFAWYTAGSGSAGTAITFTQQMGLDSSGNATLNTGNLVQGTAAKGINFTANTPAAGKTSQLLNWYEEGTWTPAVYFGAGTTGVTYASRQGTYTRIGRSVTIQCQVALSSKGSSTGAMSITGLPFTPQANATAVTAWIDTSAATIVAPVTSLIFASNPAVNFFYVNAGSQSNYTNTQAQDTSNIVLTATYFV